jgi:UDP-glucose 4-epimerase
MRRLTSALVLGGAGFLGGRLVEALSSEEIRATVVDDLSTGQPERIGAAELIVADVREVDLPGIIHDRSVDVVFHLAGPAYVPPSLKEPLKDLNDGAGTTLAVLEGIRKVEPRPLLAFASSAAVYGDGRFFPMTEDHPLGPVSPYGVSKLASEQYVRLYSRLYGIPAFSVRLFSLYGPGQRKQVIYDLIGRAVGGEAPLVVHGSPDVSRDFVFVDDAAKAFLALARRAPAEGEAYNAASGRPTTLGELVAVLLEVTGVDITAFFTGAVRRGDPLRWCGDTSKAQALGVRCDTPLGEGMRQTVRWFLETHPPAELIRAGVMQHPGEEVGR